LIVVLYGLEYVVSHIEVTTACLDVDKAP